MQVYFAAVDRLKENKWFVLVFHRLSIDSSVDTIRSANSATTSIDDAFGYYSALCRGLGSADACV